MELSWSNDCEGSFRRPGRKSSRALPPDPQHRRVPDNDRCDRPPHCLHGGVCTVSGPAPVQTTQFPEGHTQGRVHHLAQKGRSKALFTCKYKIVRFMSLCQDKFQDGQEIAYRKFLFLTIFYLSLPTTKGGGEVFISHHAAPKD